MSAPEHKYEEKYTHIGADTGALVTLRGEEVGALGGIPSRHTVAEAGRLGATPSTIVSLRAGRTRGLRAHAAGARLLPPLLDEFGTSPRSHTVVDRRGWQGGCTWDMLIS